MKSFLTCFVAWAINVFDLNFEYCSYFTVELWDCLTPGWMQDSYPAWEYSWRFCPKTGRWERGWPLAF
jgi:hypothetical protein